MEHGFEMKAVTLEGKWYIEADTKELGRVLVQDQSGLPIARSFESKKDAELFIEELGGVLVKE